MIADTGFRGCGAGTGDLNRRTWTCLGYGAAVSPDLLCLAKGLSGGYLTMAATLATERVFQGFLGPPAEGLTFFHGHTYTGNALAFAAGLATLDIFHDEGILDGVGSRISHLAAEYTFGRWAIPSF